ncbi:MAG: class I SAM-dependent rRNA methyltransferase [Prevotellaceae bacterium]|jgi:23S rRNA (cytosine1962-C5)-methyltransferase|nr:class I SAM-dependent rRNA methyltransferase [Prevotellaceae bacterium]
MNPYTTLTLKPRRDESLRRLHPWVFSGAVARADGEAQEGDIVRVADAEGNFIGIGHCQTGSIAVRILTFEDEIIDEHFWRKKLEKACWLRLNIGLISATNTTFRLVYGEGDNLPGLVVDVYGETAVIQAHTVGMHLIRQMLAQLIMKIVPHIKNVFYKSENTLPGKAPVEREEGYLAGNHNNKFTTLENGLLFQVDWLHGQKTGFFIDQRENRSLLEHYAHGKHVLNMFAYTGGFSVYAMRGGAKSVHSVDSSAKAIELTDINIEQNFPQDVRHKSFTEDAFKYLKNTENKYDLIVLDPPAFAKHRDAISNALRGYQRLNRNAFEKIAVGGLLFTFSCSQAVTKEQFRLAVMSAAVEAGRNVRILHLMSQPADHPINIFHPEGEYLKGLVLYVE